MTVFESLLNHEFAHLVRRRTSDGQGGWAIDYVSLAPVQGRMRPASSTERERAAQENHQITHIFYCLAGESVARGDRLGYGGLLVDVVGVREPSLAGEHLEIDCEERQQEGS
jgi:SPP1 family predicted phage head-tail adaptor